MTEARSAAEVGLDDIVSEGVALDLFEADLARLLLEELDRFVEQINQTGIGKHFAANLQRILQRDLVLGLSRLYAPYSDRNPGRSLPAMLHHIETHAAELRVWQRESLIDFLTARGESRPTIEAFSDEHLSLSLSSHLGMHVARADATSGRPGDEALARLKTVRDKRVAHHDRVSHSSLLIPGWPHLVDLIDGARAMVEMVADTYLRVGYNLAGDAKDAARSLRRLLTRAGLSDGTSQTPA
jgi:AbiU2